MFVQLNAVPCTFMSGIWVFDGVQRNMHTLVILEEFLRGWRMLAAVCCERRWADSPPSARYLNRGQMPSSARLTLWDSFSSVGLSAFPANAFALMCHERSSVTDSRSRKRRLKVDCCDTFFYCTNGKASVAEKAPLPCQSKRRQTRPFPYRNPFIKESG